MLSLFRLPTITSGLYDFAANEVREPLLGGHSLQVSKASMVVRLFPPPFFLAPPS